MTEPVERMALTVRNPMREWDHAESRLMFQGTDRTEPVVTIAVPTFRRPGLLVESVASALAQEFDRPFEIMVVDNDPASRGWEALLDALPELRLRAFRYYVHSENIGMTGNFDRAMELAWGDWLTILNDDDLLEPDFLRTMFEAVERDPAIAGISCTKRSFYEGAVSAPPAPSLPRRTLSRIMRETQFAGQKVRRITLRHFFWGPVLGNVVGFMFRRDHALAIGGLYPEEYPSDTLFMNRYAVSFGIWQHRQQCARIRIGQNETLNVGTARDILVREHQLREAAVRRGLPRWYRHLSPLVAARQRAQTRKFFGIDLPVDELESAMDHPLPKDRPILFRVFRVLLRGF